MCDGWHTSFWVSFEDIFQLNACKGLDLINDYSSEDKFKLMCGITQGDLNFGQVEDNVRIYYGVEYTCDLITIVQDSLIDDLTFI